VATLVDADVVLGEEVAVEWTPEAVGLAAPPQAAVVTSVRPTATALANRRKTTMLSRPRRRGRLTSLSTDDTFIGLDPGCG